MGLCATGNKNSAMWAVRKWPSSCDSQYQLTLRADHQCALWLPWGRRSPKHCIEFSAETPSALLENTFFGAILIYALYMDWLNRPEEMKFSLLRWARCTRRGVPVMSLWAGLCLLLSRICSAFCLWVLQGGAGAEAPSGVQTRTGAQAAVLLAASDKIYEFRSVPAFLVSLLLSPTSETVCLCHM